MWFDKWLTVNTGRRHRERAYSCVGHRTRRWAVAIWDVW